MSHFRVYKQGRSRKSSPFPPLKSHNFPWFRAPSLKCVKTQTYVPFLVFLYGLLDPVLNRVRNYSTFSLIGYQNLHLLCLELSQGFVESAEPPLPKFLLSTLPGVIYLAQSTNCHASFDMAILEVESWNFSSLRKTGGVVWVREVREGSLRGPFSTL